MADLYAALGIDPDASPAEVKAAHRRRAKQTHPDREGGNREAFDRVQRAYGILSDHSKRAKYDETGVEMDMPENLEESQALTILSQKLANLVGNEQINPRIVDILTHLKREMAEEAQQARAEKVKSERQITRAQEFQKRLKVKEGETNRLTQVIESQITAHRGRIEAVDAALRVYEIAQALAADYLYETDKPEPSAAYGVYEQQMLQAMKMNLRGSIFNNNA